MQDQHIEKVVAGDDGDLPADLVAEIKKAGAIIIVGEDEDGVMTIRPTVPGSSFDPETNKVHAYVHAIRTQHAHLLETIHGLPTDAVRYRALRDFAMFGQREDKTRFEQVNTLMTEFEKSGKIAPEGKRSEQDFDVFCEFLAHAIRETEPVLAAPTARPELDPPKIIVPGTTIQH